MAEGREVKIKLIVSDDGTLRVIDQTGKKLADVGGEAERLNQVTTRAFTGIKTAALAGTAAIVAGGVAAVYWGKQAIDAAAGQEAAIRRLDAQLQISGQYSDAYSLKLQRLSGEYQDLAAVADDAVLDIMRQLTAFGATDKNIERVTKAVLDLSAGMGTDVSSGAFLMGKALAGEFGTLSRYGIFVNEAASKSAKLDEALSQIEKRFGGQAAAAAATFTGRIEGLKLSFGDLLEEIGNTVVQSDAFKNGIADLNHWVKDATADTMQWVSANRELIELNIGEWVQGLAGNLPEATTAMGEMGKATRSVAEGFASIAKLLNSEPNLLKILLNKTVARPIGAGAAWALDALERARDNETDALAAAGYDVGYRGRKVGRISPEAAERAFYRTRAVWPPQEGVTAFDASQATGFGPVSTGGAGESVDAAAASAMAAGRASAEVVRQQTALAIAEARLKVAGELKQSEEEQLAIAREVDAARRSVLDAQIAELAAQKQLGDAKPEAAAKIDAQIAGLQAQKGLIEETTGAVAELNRHYEEQRDAIDVATIAAQGIRATAMLETLEQRLAVSRQLGASEQEQLAIAVEIDEQKKITLETELRSTQAQIAQLPQLSEERVLLEAQADALKMQVGAVDELTGTVPQLTREFQAQHKITMDLASTMSDSLTRWRDFGDGSDFLTGMSQRISDEFISGLVKSTLFKDTWDAQIGENFSVTLPGFLKTGMDSMTSIWSGGLSGMASNAQSTVSSLGSMFSGLGDSIGGIFRNVPRLSAMFSSGEGAVAGTQSVTNPMFTSPWAAEGQSVMGVGDVAGGASGAAGGAAAAGMSGATAALLGVGGVLFAAATADAMSKTMKANEYSGKSRLELAKDVVGSIPLIGGIAKYGLGSYLLAPLMPQKTRGTLIAHGLESNWAEAGLPITRGWRADDMWGFLNPQERQQSLARYGYGTDELYPGQTGANAEAVSGLRFGASLGAIATLVGPEAKGQSDILGTANRLTNVLIAQGVSDKEGLRQIREFMGSQGYGSFGDAINGFQNGYQEADGTAKELFRDQEFLTDSVQGLADIWADDFPKSVDVAAIGMEHWSEQAGFDIAAVNEHLERSVALFGGLESSAQSALSSAVTATFQSGSTADFATTFKAGIYQATYEGLSTAAIDALKDTDAFVNISVTAGTMINDIVQGALTGDQSLLAKAQLVDMPAFRTSVDDFIAGIDPAIEAFAYFGAQFAEWAEAVEEAAKTTSYGFKELADTAYAARDALTIETVAPVDQLGYVRGEIARDRAAYAMAATDEERRAALDELMAGGQDLQAAGQRYSRGSAAYREVMGESADLFDWVGDQASLLADDVSSQTDATTANTEALNANTTALYETGGETAGGGGGGASATPVLVEFPSDLKAVFEKLAQAVESPQSVTCYNEYNGIQQALTTDDLKRAWESWFDDYVYRGNGRQVVEKVVGGR